MTERETSIECTDVSLGVLMMPYVLQTLAEEDKERFEDHLLDCSACRSELETSTQTLQLFAENRQEILHQLRDAGESYEAGLTELEEHRTTRHATSSSARRDARGKSFYIRLSAGLVAAAVFVSGLWSGSSYFRNGPAPIVQNIPGELMTDKLLADSSIAIPRDTKSTPTPAPQMNLAALATTVKLPFAVTSVRGDENPKEESFNVAMQAYLADDFKSAQQQLSKLSDEQPLSSEIWLYLGVCAYLNDDLDMAERSLYRGLKLNPRITRTQQLRWYLANTELKRGQAAPVKRLLDSIIRADAVYVTEAKELRQRLDQMISK